MVRVSSYGAYHHDASDWALAQSTRGGLATHGQAQILPATQKKAVMTELQTTFKGGPQQWPATLLTKNQSVLHQMPHEAPAAGSPLTSGTNPASHRSQHSFDSSRAHSTLAGPRPLPRKRRTWESTPCKLSFTTRPDSLWEHPWQCSRPSKRRSHTLSLPDGSAMDTCCMGHKVVL